MFKKIIERYRSFILVIIFLIIFGGISSFLSIPKESIPDVNLPFFIINAFYPGADSSTVEQQVTTKIEDKLSSVKNISSYKSVSAPGVSVITVEFDRGVNKSVAYSDLKLAVDEAKINLPNQVRDSLTIKEVDLKDIPVYVFAVIGENYPSFLYDKTRFIENDIKKISGVDRVIVIGKYIPQVEIHFDYSKLIKYNLKISTLVQIINDSIKEQFIGKKKIDGNLYTFEISTYNKTGTDLINMLENFKKDLEKIPLINKNGNILRLKDIADIQISHPFYERLSYIDGKVGITYMIYKTKGADMIKLISDIKKYLSSKKDFFDKNNLQVVEVSSKELMINKTFNTFISNFWQTALIIFLVIFLFIGLKESVGVVLSFPLVYFLTFIFLKLIGYTFNSIVSFSLVLTLGIMVDNLIVIVEGVEDGLKRGLDKINAIGYSLKTYWSSLLAGNLTTVVMFFPLNFMLSGKIGEFIKYLPTTVNITLIFSFIVSLVFLPIILSFLPLKIRKVKKDKNYIYDIIVKIIYKLLRFPKLIVLGFWLIFLISTYIFFKFGSFDFLSPTDRDNIYVNIKYDSKITLKENLEFTNKIYHWIKEFFAKYHPGILKHIEITLGDRQTSSALDAAVYRNSFNPELSKINIVLISSKNRDEKDNAVKIYPELNKYLKEKVKYDDDLKKFLREVNAFIQKSGPSQGKDVTFNIAVKLSGYKFINYQQQLKILAENTEKILNDLNKIPGTYGWGSTLEYTNGKLKIIYDLDNIRRTGLTVNDINFFLLSIYQKDNKIPYLMNYKGGGLNITSLKDFGKDIISVKGYVDMLLNQKLDFRSIIIPGTDVYLNNVIKSIDLKPEVKSLYHSNGTLIVKIDAYKDPYVPLGEITKQINKILSKYPDVKLFYASDVKEMKQSVKDLGKAFLLGILLMFAVLVFQFGNFYQAIIVLLSLPLLFIGSFWLLLISGLPFSFAAQLGMFGLIGVGVNNAILLVDRFNDLIKKESGKTNLEYILLEVIRSRIKPIFLTTLTTILGLLTLALKDELWGSLALSFMGGLIVGTLIILIYIPAMLKIKTFNK